MKKKRRKEEENAHTVNSVFVVYAFSTWILSSSSSLLFILSFFIFSSFLPSFSSLSVLLFFLSFFLVLFSIPHNLFFASWPPFSFLHPFSSSLHFFFAYFFFTISPTSVSLTNKYNYIYLTSRKIDDDSWKQRRFFRFAQILGFSIAFIHPHNTDWKERILASFSD